MKAIIKTGEPLYNNLTLGKWYNIKEISVETPHMSERVFKLMTMRVCFCIQFNCSWINDGSLEIFN